MQNISFQKYLDPRILLFQFSDFELSYTIMSKPVARDGTVIIIMVTFNIYSCVVL